MHVIILIVIAVLFIVSPVFRVIVIHPVKVIYNGIIDFTKYIYHKSWRLYKSEGIVCYSGLFGSGKTLSAVNKIVGCYQRYNNKRVYDPFDKKWKTQRVHVISNVNLSIPYIPFTSCQQIVDIASVPPEDGYLDVYYILGDEFSILMNSRNFKSNISTDLLNTILTSRHYHIAGLYYTSQRFNLCDKLFRDVTTIVIDCKKIWRIEVQNIYDAWTLENVADVTKVQPKMRTGWFISNYHYNLYNTLAVVTDLVHRTEKGEMLSDEEILALRSPKGSFDADSQKGLVERIFKK